MIKTLDVISYSIINTVRPILKRTDFIDIRDVREWVKNERNELAKQQVDKNLPFIPPRFLQTEKVTLQAISQSAKFPDVIITTSTGLPSILSAAGGEPIVESISYKEILIDKIQMVNNINTLVNYVKSDRFDRQAIYAGIFNGELVIAGTNSILIKGLDQAYITAVFDTPEIVSTFDVAADSYPIEQNLLPTLEKKVIQEKYGIGLANYYDETNDESHNLQNESPDV